MNKPFLPALFILGLLSALSACATGPSASPVDGSWDFTMSSPFGAVNAKVIMTTDGDTLTGSFDMGNGRVWPIENGVVSGNEISFRIDRDGSPMVYEMKATVEGDTVTGAAQAMGAEVPWSMTRSS